MADTTETLIAALRASIRDQDAHRRAAVELLIWHEGWLRSRDFITACVTRRGGIATVNWASAREFSDRVTAGGLGAPHASTTEAALLDLAVALGEEQVPPVQHGHRAQPGYRCCGGSRCRRGVHLGMAEQDWGLILSDLRPGTTMHRIAELERVTRELRQDVRELRGLLEVAEGRIAALEGSTPEARQAEYEADVALADLAESGYG